MIQIDRYKTTRAIKDLEIPKSDLAALADVLPCRVSDYISGKRVPSAIAARIEEAVANVVKVWTVLPVRTDISDQQSFAKALEIADNAIAKIEAEDAEAALEDLRVRPA